jgi:hypothetical protein
MKKMTLAALLAASAFSPAAFAQYANSTVTFSNFHYTLTDLTPNDGLAPSATFTFTNSVYATGSDTAIEESASSKDDMVTKQVTVSAPGYNATASITAGTDIQHLTGAAAAASGSVTLTGKEPDGQFNTYASHASIYDGTFILAPGTRITFYADIHAFASLDTGTADQDAFAVADGTMIGWGGVDGSGIVDAKAIIRSDDLGPKTDETTNTIQITFSNYGFKPNTGHLYAETSVYGYVFVNTVPVPEPSTYAMFLAGLGLIGFAKRRRK